MRDGECTDAARAQRPPRAVNAVPRVAGRVPARRPGPPVLDMPFDGPRLTALRFAVTAQTADLDDRRTAGDVVLVAQELATNAVRHGGGGGRLRLWCADGRVVCQVSDSGAGRLGQDAGTTPPDPSLPGGRGLWISRRLATLTIESSPGGTTVTATLPPG